MKITAVPVLVLLALIMSALPAAADTLNFSLGAAGGYTVVDLGNGTTLGLNSGPIQGNVLLGNGVTAAFSGGNNGQITGTLFYDSTVQGTNTFSQLATPPTTATISTATTAQALSDAKTASVDASALTMTQTFGNITGTTMITGNGGLNVIDVTSIQNAPLTLSGTANDFFIFNVTGNIQTNQLMTLSGGVLASHILWNLTGTSGNVLQTSGGDRLYGTFLATDGGGFNFSNLDLDGALINTAGNVQIVSGSEIPTSAPFTPPASVPEPTSLSLLGIGLGGLALRLRNKLAA